MRGSVKPVNTLNRAVRNLAATAAAFFGGRAIIRGARDLLQAWAVQEEAVTSLRAALSVTGKDGSEALELLTKRAGELQQVTTKGDEAIIAATASFALLAPALDAPELARAQEAIIGIADTFLKGDVQNAALLVGKSIGSTTNALTRYGIQIDVNATQSEKLNSLLEQSNSFFEVSKERTNTLAGAQQQLSNVVGDLKEAFGKLIAQRTGLTEFLQAATNLVADLVVIMSGTAPQLEQAFRDLGIIGANAFAASVNSVISALLEKAALGPLRALAQPLSRLFGDLAEEARANIRGAIIDIDELAESIRKAGQAAPTAAAEAATGLEEVLVPKIEKAMQTSEELILEGATRAGRSFISGFIRGTQSLKDLLVNAIFTIAELWILGTLEKSLKIKSPSRAAADIGANVVEGLAGTAGGLGRPRPVPIEAGLVINQTINLNVAAVDGPSAAAFLRTQKGTIAELMGEAAQESPGFARMIRGR